ncbi:response regulator [Altererythrobacter salegens]|uniref:Response regulator n=1 Tax=Croceibacterium salegens TaxID=1737568 RepID=A0A6I4SRA2_9SPHN|nr:response regulator [Croceibacterium salegens]MXO58394.1 response regulator [Croceibacterium salegens]
MRSPGLAPCQHGCASRGPRFNGNNGGREVAFILIVDSDATGAERAADALIAAGYACGWVCNAKQAHTLLRWREPELILLDEDMPGQKEGSLLRELRSTEPCRDTPIILLSTTAGNGNSEQLLPCAAHDHIRKPFDPRFLVWRVNHAIDTVEAKPKREQAREWLAQKFESTQRRSIG